MCALSGKRLLEIESIKCFKYFWNETNTNQNSSGYGLIRDRAPGNPRVCSIAAVGFGLTAIAVGAERGWISKDKAYKRVIGTLDTLLYNTDQINGFFYHFLDLYSAQRYWQSEVSIIDTAILICGAIAAGEYFGGEIRQKSIELFKRVDWEWYRDTETNQFYIGYTPEKGFWGNWDSYAEQFMVYFLAAVSPTYKVNSDTFYSFSIDKGYYKSSQPIIYSYNGSLFTYQFTHAWFDLRNKKDSRGVNWWENSVRASEANRNYCIDYSNKYKTFNSDSWGLTACDGPYGYSGEYGAPPRGKVQIHKGNDGSIAPCGAAGSIVFTPEESISAMGNYYNSFPQLWGRYGFRDAYNLDLSPAWFARDVIAIDKGITLLMLENYMTGFVWDVFMNNCYAEEGISAVGFM